ncbi:hypothetical protein [Methanobrevibacter sp.]|uniref:hypothetical protein n=1 Tax=Methanobrevibacter sp. TaxID=66852 RepID=UPI00386DC0E9
MTSVCRVPRYSAYLISLIALRVSSGSGLYAILFAGLVILGAVYLLFESVKVLV